MADLTQLFTRGLRWSYREYGLIGAVGFLAVVAAGYYVLNERFDGAMEGESPIDLDPSGDRSGTDGGSGSSQ